MQNPEDNESKPKKRVSITSTTLGWIAERMRRAMKIKESLDSGTYQVDTEKVAKALVNEE